MEIQVVFDPRLGVDGEEFAARWNETAENIAVGPLAVRKAPAQKFGEPTTILAIAMAVVTEVAKNVAWEAVKATYHRLCAAKDKPPQPIEIQQIEYPDGTKMTIVKLKD